jgi:hypothetical protein
MTRSWFIGAVVLLLLATPLAAQQTAARKEMIAGTVHNLVGQGFKIVGYSSDSVIHRHWRDIWIRARSLESVVLDRRNFRGLISGLANPRFPETEASPQSSAPGRDNGTEARISKTPSDLCQPSDRMTERTARWAFTLAHGKCR